MAKANDKHARELKRLAKKKLAARAAAGDPWVGVPCDDAQLTCVESGELRRDGQCGLTVMRRLPGGGVVIASFMIDRGVVGLKDAWGYAPSSLAEFNEMLAKFRDDDFALARVAPGAARALVAGAARYADEYGFKLPKDWQRWAGVLGGVGDWRVADTAPFRPEYAETIAYARRLVGQTPEAFFARPDITFDFPDGEGEPPRDPDAERVGLTGETVVPTPADAWVEPTPAAYATAVRAFDRRRASIAAEIVAALGAAGVAAGPHVGEDGVAARAAALCLARFGRPPTARVRDLALPAGVDAEAVDAFYFYGRILAEVFGRPAAAPDAAHAFVADDRAARALAGPSSDRPAV